MAENTLIAHPSGALPTLQKWFGDGMVDIWGAWPATEKPWIVMSCAVWGDYVKRFIDFSVPTMLTPANLKALAPCWAVIYTDPQGWPIVWDAMRNLEPLGIKLILRLIPEPVLEMLHRDDTNRYWGLSVAQNLGMRVAGHVGAGYHMWMPDHYYGPNYFKSLKRLSPDHDIIAQTGISATLDCLPEIYRYRQADGSIAIPDRDLGTIALRHLHPQSRAYCMNQAEPFTEMPGAHFIWWQGRNAIHTYCCHQNATWLSPRVCTHAPNFVPATIDTRLPHFGEKFYVPTPADEMTFAEFSGANKAALQGLVPGNVFFARCWSQVGFSLRYRDYFMQPSLTPVEPQTTFMTDGAIARQHKQVADRLWAERPPEWMGTLVQ